jgi:protein involved in polysaccharide export with SLBB domain
MKRFALFSILLLLGTAAAQQAQLAAALASGGPTGGLVPQEASGSFLRKQDFPSYPIADSLFHLSSGDQLRLRWWGTGSGDLDLVVDTRGDLVLPEMGTIRATGATLRTVRDSVEAMLHRRTKVSLVDLQLVKIVQAQVWISGRLPSPGPVEISPGTPLSEVLQQGDVDVNKLLQRMQMGDAVWQPSEGLQPSLRRILVIRGGKDSSWFDLIRAMRSGDATQDPPLFNGDHVVLCPSGPVVQISGAVDFPGGMELVYGETLEHFLSAAGESSNVVPEVDGRPPPSLDAKLDSGVSLVRYPGRPLPQRPSIAWILGKVQNQGAYFLKPGMTAQDLVALAGGIPGGADSGVVVAIKRGWAWLGAGRDRGLAEATQYPEVRFAMLAYFSEMRGTYVDPQTPLQAGDTVFVHPAEQVVWVGGEVKKPGFVPWKKGATIDEYVRTAGGYASRAWESRTRVFDLQSGLSLDAKSAEIRPGAAVIVPEARYIPPDQWLGIAASVASLALTMVILYVTVIK